MSKTAEVLRHFQFELRVEIDLVEIVVVRLAERFPFVHKVLTAGQEQFLEGIELVDSDV
jgi:hypothetical protein